MKIRALMLGLAALTHLSCTELIPISTSEVKDISVEMTAEKVARGRYLAMHVSSCIDCHSERDFTKFAGPVKPDSFGKGGERFGEEIGIPGTIYAPNITPHSLKDWTDGELFRVITEGVTKDGKALFPLMPYKGFANMTPDDVTSIIAYLRTLDPVENSVPKRELNFPLNYIVRTIPSPYVEKNMPQNTSEEKGKYLVTIADCGDCHTPMEKGEPIEGMDFAGGNKYKLPWGEVTSANITPDSENGIGSWSKEAFIARFKQSVTDPEAEYAAKGFNTIMPWTLYGGMTVEDLGAIYDYLKTVKANPNSIQKFKKL